MNIKALLKRRWVKPVLSLAVIVFLFCNSSSFMNAIALATTDPSSYYHMVEKEDLRKHVNTIANAYTTYISSQQNGVNKEIGQETTIDATLDSSLTNDTSFEGLKNIKATINSMVKGKDSKTNMKLSCNNEELTSLDFYTLNDLIYFLIPDLSKAYLKLDPKSLQSQYTTQEYNINQSMLTDPKTVDLLNQLIKKYGYIVIDHMDRVTMKENVSVTADNIKSNYTKLTVSINEKDTLDISKAVLLSAKTDTQLRDFAVKLGICTEKEYNTTMKDCLSAINDGLKENKKSKDKDIFKMVVWVNDDGKITGRSFNVDNSYDIGYKTTSSLNKTGVEAWIKLSGKDMLHANGRFTAGLTGVSGDFMVSYPNAETETSSAIYIDFNHVKFDKNNSIGRINGEFTITGNDLADTTYHLKFTGEPDKQQDILFDMTQNYKSLAVVSTTIKNVPFKEFTLPSSEDKSYDMNTQLDEYFKDADVKKYLNGIKEKSSLSCIDNYMDELIKDYDENKDSMTNKLKSLNPYYYQDGYLINDEQDYIDDEDLESIY